MSGHYCGPVEFVVTAPIEWRDMSEAEFEVMWAQHERAMRDYRKANPARPMFRQVVWVT